MFVIAGVSGHVGAAAATELLDAKEKVKVLVRDAKKGEAWAKKGAEVAVASLEDEAALTIALRGAKGFFTLLPPSYTAPDFYAYQRATAQKIAGAVKAAGVPHVVMLSSTGADLADGNGPIKGLHHLENALRATGAKLTAIRAGSFQENVEMALTPAKTAGMFPSFMPSPDYAVPRIATRDIGHLVAESLRHPPARSEVVDLQGPAYSDRQIAEKLGKRLGKPLNVVTIPASDHVGALVQGGVSPQLAAVFAEMYAGFASGKIKPVGDRMVEGKRTIDETIENVVPAT